MIIILPSDEGNARRQCTLWYTGQSSNRYTIHTRTHTRARQWTIPRPRIRGGLGVELEVVGV